MVHEASQTRVKLIDRYIFTVHWIADYVRCRVVKDGIESTVEAQIVPREDGKGYWLDFPIESPFTLLSIEGGHL